MFSFIAKKYKLNSDEELMLFVIKGNERAFDELYNRYSEKMVRFFHQRLYRDDEKAQDFLQDLFIKIIEKADGYNPDLKFKVWIYSIAANMCKNEYRRLDVRGVKVNDYDFDKILEELPLNNLTDKYDKDLFSRILTSELHKLDENHSLTFVLRYKEYMTVKEISQVMECCEGTVKSRLFYTIKKLSQKLAMFNPYKEIK
ncbi:MAG: RNA polymerase sigma factor [Mucilaginibacter sp.]|uniref:RNA polymerase sigma factor n=1 Tax=Mucilaginibacter sp. TaxID=1882438 RepID=UPI0034E3ED60